MRLLVLLIMIQLSPLFSQEVRFGETRKVEGEVNINRLFRQHVAIPKMVLLNGDEVVTQLRSNVLIRLEEGNDLFVDEQTQMKLSRDEDRQKIRLELITGTIQGRMKNLKGQILDVETPIGTVQVVGTEFSVSFHPGIEQPMQVQVLEGEVLVTLNHREGELNSSFNVGKYQQLSVSSDQVRPQVRALREDAPPLQRLRELRERVHADIDHEGDGPESRPPEKAPRRENDDREDRDEMNPKAIPPSRPQGNLEGQPKNIDRELGELERPGDRPLLRDFDDDALIQDIHKEEILKSFKLDFKLGD